MKLAASLTALLLCVAAGLAFAQNNPQPLQTVRPAVIQPVTPVQPAPITATPTEQSAADVDTDVVDPQGTIQRLRERNRALKAENERLKGEVGARDATIAEFMKRGGSRVTAYCEAKNVSRNTAGATQSCGSFACNDVSGLCYTQCTLTEHCSTGACYNGQCLTQAPPGG
jgi:hypothetical protein